MNIAEQQLKDQEQGTIFVNRCDKLGSFVWIQRTLRIRNSRALFDPSKLLPQCWIKAAEY